jgi:hypothetical protein
MVAVPILPATAGGATPPGYNFTPIAFLGDAAPGGGNFINDFEPSAVNNSGQVAFVADLTTPEAGNEGVFLWRQGQTQVLAQPGQPAPGGGTFTTAPGLELGRVGLNDAGDASFAFALDPSDPTDPLANSGVYRFSHSSQTLSAILVPGEPAPGGGTFMGAFYHTGINNRGDVVFAGTVPTAQGGRAGLFLSRTDGNTVSVARPGDPAPGGGVFDMAINGSINGAGDIAFGGHVAGEECEPLLPFPPLVCGESVYLSSSRPDNAPPEIRSIAHIGDTSPCGARPYRTAFGALINSVGDIAFIGDLTPAPDFAQVHGVFLFSKGRTRPVACPGAAMPGGGTMETAGFQDNTYGLNNRGQVTFAATLNTSSMVGVHDSGIYSFFGGSNHLVARTGTVIPGVGTIASVGLGVDPPSAQAGAQNNDRGQVLLSATLTDNRVVLLLATPT